MTSQVHISTHPLVQHKMALLRDQRTDPKKFRELLREMAVLIAYEATADLATEEWPVMTPLGQLYGHRLRGRVGLVPILRAGLGMVEGVWNLMHSAHHRLRMSTAATADPPVASIGSRTRQTLAVGLTGRRL